MAQKGAAVNRRRDERVAARAARNQAALQRGNLSNVGSQSARGAAWTLSAQWGLQLVKMGSIVVLARLLTPDDYGLLAMVWPITGFVAMLGGLGLTAAVVQRAHLTHEQLSNLFWLNVGVGVLLTGVIAAGAPLIASFYGRDELVGITIAIAPTLLLVSLAAQHQSLMQRQLKFRGVATRVFVAGVAEVAFAVAAAVAGAGYWALVIGQVGGAVVSLITVWTAVRWRPGRPGRAAGTRELVSFGGGVSTFGILNFASQNLDNVLIGKFLGGEQLGLYSRGYGLLMLPLQQVHAPLGNVVRPTLAGLWPEPDRYRRYYLAALSGLCFVVAPVVVVLAVLAEEVVTVLLGERWIESAEVFRWLAIAGLLQTVGYTNGWLYVTSGRAWALARWGLISRPIVMLSFVVGLPWGITGVAISYAAAQLVLTPLGIARASRGTPVRLRDVVRVCARPMVVAFTAGGVAALAYLIVPDASALVTALVGGGLAALTIVGLIAAWPSARREVLGLVGHMRGRPSVVAR